jgi:hypothetical protein
MSNNPIIVRQINLNSVDAIKNNGSNNSDLLFNFKNLISEDERISHIDFSVENAQFPVSFYNITSNNNKLDISLNGGAQNVLTITEGNYNTTTLNTEIITQLSNAGITTITITLSTVTGKYSFTIDSGYFTFHYATSTILKVLGFITTQDHTSTSQVLTSNYPVNLLGPLKLKIFSNAIAVDNIDSNNDGSTVNSLIELPISAANFGLILYTNISNIHSNMKTKNLNSIDIRITDDNNNLIDFNGVDFTMSFLIKIYYVEKQTLVHQKDPHPPKTISSPSTPKISGSNPEKKDIDDLSVEEILLNNN